MLTVTSLLPSTEPEVVFDLGPVFVGTVVPWEPRSGIPLYWRATGSKSLLEVALDYFSGALYDVTLVIVDRKKILKVDSFPFLANGSEGVPVFETTPWPTAGREPATPAEYSKTFLDEELEMRLVIGRAAVSLLLGADCHVSEVVSLGRLRFGLTQSRELRRLDIVDLTADDVGTLQEFVSLPEGGGIPPQIVPRDQVDKRSRPCHGQSPAWRRRRY